MAFEIRPCRTPEEIKQYDAMGAYVFADPQVGAQDVQTQADWTLCAFDGERVASQVGAFPFTVRLNGNPVHMAGVTMVGTLPQYRRQGLLRQLMEQAFRDQRERGQPLAILWASMGAIYQRFGYGIASDSVKYAFDPRTAQLREPWTGAGQVTIETPEEAYATIKQLFIEYATTRNLVIHRSSALWHADTLKAFPKDRPVYVAVYRDAGGSVRGYLVYQTSNWTEARRPGPDQLFDVKDFIALDLDAHRALWEFILKHDLVAQVQMRVSPDNPAPELLLEPRMLKTAVSDAIWMRVVDAGPALAARPYGDRGELSIRMHDAMCPWNSGTWLLETDGPTAEARQVERTPDLTVTPNALATLIAGARTATHLSRAGAVEGSAEVLKRADRIFRTEYAPFCPNNF
ncbi:MAG: enhanced intracellular survival protein Eis [Dehalococcoidia bacterium]